MLLLWSMNERHNRNFKYKLYFDTLPEKFYTSLSFEVGAVAALDGTFSFEELCQAKEHLRSQYDQMFPALCTVNPDVFPPKIYTWENYLWACELWYSNSMKVLFTDGNQKTCLVPVAGFLNHSICPHVVSYGKVDARTNSLKFPLARPCRAGEESFSGGLESCSEDDDMSDSDGSMHMVRGTSLSKHHGIFYYGLPTPLLQYLRKVENSPLHTMILSQSNVEKELVVLENLRSIFVMIDSRYRIDEYRWYNF
ncbi:hypothetical protein AKJ16_DCAP21946 [Drosera capensis]